MTPEEFLKRRIFHIVDYRNVPSIFEKGTLFPDSEVDSIVKDRVSIAHANIKNRRAQTLTPLGCRVSECVPFYFCIRSPMLSAIHHSRVHDYDGGQANIVYLVSRVYCIRDLGIPFCFTDGHAVEALTNFFTDLSDCDKVDWDAVEARLWAASLGADEDCKRRKQSEFLVRGNVPVSAILGMVVHNEQIQAWLKQYIPSSVRILVNSNFYF